MPTTVADVMSRNPIVVHPEDSLSEAVKTLAERRISGLPVVDQSGNLVGVISESDLMWQEAGMTPPAYIMILDSVIYLENPAKYERDLHKALGQTVGEVMTKKELVTVAPETPIRKAAQLMHDRKVHRLLVVDAAGHLIGVLTRGDIVRFMASHTNEDE
ncbi:MAG: CBS domain-containing protein [Leptolyngbya sp. IPPAS B-1204]|nr:CBS domain-containing protein [Elainella sp. C42_A2020_010]RNJ70260.1 MAG: CBS domain-containing protein [Leptolyngbya sp. IPPAS B-1204]